MKQEILEIAKIGYLKTEKGPIPCSAFITEQDIQINLDLIAGSCVSLYELFMSCLPDDKQIYIEENFMKRFGDMLKYRAEYMESLKPENVEFKNEK